MYLTIKQIKQAHMSKQDKEQTKQDKEQRWQEYVSKCNNERDTQVNLLMITDGTGNWHYLAVKSISGLLKGITSNHNGDFHCLNGLHSYTTEEKLEKMPDEDNKVLKYVPSEKSLKVPFTIYADLECLLKKINTCSNNPDKSYAEKKTIHKPWGYFLVTCCSFDKLKNERKCYRGEDCMKMFVRI